MNWDDINDESVELFKELLRIDTTNPPGAEKPAAELIADLLAEDGLDPVMLEKAPGRTCVIARLPATTDETKGGPLLLTGHLDVVPANPDEWTYPPFDATEADGCIWGRGAVDMKNMVAMCTMIVRLMSRHDMPRNRDIILACVADEEEGCEHGSKFLVEEHPDLVRAEYALGEVGGFSLHVGKATYFPVMVAEKGQAHLRMTARGEPGHASIPRKDNPIIRLSRALAKLGEGHLPHHVTPTMQRFLNTLAETQGLPEKLVIPKLANPRVAEFIMDKLLPADQGRSFGALLHNTASPTMMDVGVKRNVIPSSASVDFDGRTLPGYDANDLVREMEERIGDREIDIEILSETPPLEMLDWDTPLYQHIRRTVGRHDPNMIVTPYQLTGFTDAQYFSRLGTKFYGCSPLQLPKPYNIKFTEMFHGIDERVPREGYEWGQRVLFDIVSGFVKP